MSLLTKIFKTLIISVLISGLLSCGFHLRGQMDIPMHAMPVYLYADDGYHDLRRDLLELFKQNEVSTTSTETSAATTIKLNRVKQANRVVSVDSLGRVREYLLTTVVSFTLTDQHSTSTKSIQVTRDVDYDANNILAFKKEEATLLKEMNKDIARLILLQLQAASNGSAQR